MGRMCTWNRGIHSEKEYKIESDDFVECLLRQEVMKHLSDIRRQRDELIREGKNTIPAQHMDKEDPRPRAELLLMAGG